MCPSPCMYREGGGRIEKMSDKEGGVEEGRTAEREDGNEWIAVACCARVH